MTYPKQPKQLYRLEKLKRNMPHGSVDREQSGEQCSGSGVQGRKNMVFSVASNAAPLTPGLHPSHQGLAYGRPAVSLASVH